MSVMISQVLKRPNTDTKKTNISKSGNSRCYSVVATAGAGLLAYEISGLFDQRYG